MKKMIYFLIVCLVLVLTSCNRELIVFEQTEYELGIEEVIKLEYTSRKKNKEVEFKVENESVIKYEDGKLFAKSLGYTKVYVGFENKYFVVLEVNVVQKMPKILVEDVEQNKTLINEIEIFMGKSLLKMMTTNYLTIDVEMTLEKQSAWISEKVIANPMYVEIKTNTSKFPNIITLEDNKVFLYSFIEENKLDREFVSHIDSFDLNQMDNSIFSNYDFEFNPETMNFRMIDDKYWIQMTYEDFATMTDVSTISQIISIPQYDINKNIVEIELYNVEQTIHMDITVKFIAYEEYKLYEFHYNTVISFDEFIPYDVKDPKYSVSTPSSIEEIEGFTNVNENYKVDPKASTYTKVYLEPGVYIANHSRVDYGNVSFSIFSESNQIVNDYKTITNNFAEIFKNVFYVETAGVYYIRAVNTSNMPCTASIEGFYYDTYVDMNVKREVQSNNTCLIEGKYDYEYFTFEGFSDTGIKIRNMSKKTIIIIYKGLDGTEGAKQIFPGGYFKLTENEKTFFVTSFENEAYTYEFTAEAIN